MIDQIQATEQPVAVCMMWKPLFRRKLCHEEIPTNSKEFTCTPPVKTRRAYITVAAVSAFEGITFFFLKKKKKPHPLRLPSLEAIVIQMVWHWHKIIHIDQ